MKKILFFIPLFLLAENFNQIVKYIDNSLNYQIEKEKLTLNKQQVKQYQKIKYGKLDIDYQGIYFFTRPYQKTAISNVNIADKTHYIGEIKYSFPIFDKLLNNSIKKQRIKLIKQKLVVENIKRELFLKVAQIYSNIFALKQNIKAMKLEKKALLSAKNKAQAFYKSGLMNKSNLDLINAKYYDVLAQIEELKSKKNSLLEDLSFILNKEIKDISDIEIIKYNLKPKFENRADVRVIQTTLNISKEEILLVKSLYYPKIKFQIGVKREADNFILDENKYTNIDKSYMALSLHYDFDLSKKHKLESAKIAKNLNYIFYKDYLNKIKSQFNKDKFKLKSLFYQLRATKEEIKARKSYFEYIESQFNEGLSDSEKLKDAIAKLALVQAKKDYIKSQIFFLENKLRIDGGENVFSK